MTPEELDLAAEALVYDELDAVAQQRLAEAVAADPAAKEHVRHGVREALLLHAACAADPSRTADAVMHLLRSGRSSQRIRFDHKVVSKLRRRSRPSNPRRPFGLAIALAAALAFVIAGVLLLSPAKIDVPRVIVRSGTPISADGVSLPPGSSCLGKLVAPEAVRIEVQGIGLLDLDAGTRLQIGHPLASGITVEAGRITADILPQTADRPLRLGLTHAEVVVLGTRFVAEVAAIDSVSLISGSVRIVHRTTAGSLLLRPGQACIADVTSVRLDESALFDGQAYNLWSAGTLTAVGVQPVEVADPAAPDGRCLALPAAGSGVEFAVPAQPARLTVYWREDTEIRLSLRLLVDGLEVRRIQGARRNKHWRDESVDLPAGARRVRIEALTDALPASKFEPGLPYASSVRIGRIALTPR